MVVGQIVETVTQDVVLGDDFFNIKPVLDTLSAMSGRATFAERFRDRLVRPRLECRSQFLQQIRDVVVERRDVQMPR